jgi:hypothetical protein
MNLKRTLAFLPVLLFAGKVLAQDDVTLFAVLQNDTAAAQLVSEQRQFTVDTNIIDSVFTNRPADLNLLIPVPGGRTFVAELHRVNIVSDSFIVESNQHETVNYTPGVYYRGAIRGDAHSLAAISFFGNSVMGVLSDSTGNFVVADRGDGTYICYNDKDLLIANPFHCDTEDDLPQESERSYSPGNSVQSGNCIRVYFECDYAMYLSNGSNTTTLMNFLTGMFNVVATIYNNETITLTMSSVLIWTTQDPFLQWNSTYALNSFDNYRTQFNGDVGMLLSTLGMNNGGRAHLEALCTSQRTGYSNIYNSYSSFPTYSWTVEVVSHELGHNLGSQHTHWCGWAGGPIDTCNVCFGLPTEGTCSNGPLPASGGTIMSYCYGCSNIGTNFSNGFGIQPGNAIRNYISSSSCVSCTACVPPAVPVATYGSAIVPGPVSGTTPTITWTSSASDNMVTFRRYPFAPPDNISNPNACIGTSFTSPTLYAGMVYRYEVVGHSGNCNSWCISDPSAASYFYIPPVINCPVGICDSAQLTTTNLSAYFQDCSIDYQWYLNGNPVAGATGTSFWTSIPGTYHLLVTFSGSTYYNGSISIPSANCTLVLNTTPGPIIISGADTACTNTTVTMTVTNPCAGCTYSWVGGPAGLSKTVLSTGTYTVNCYNACGFATASHHVQFISSPPPPVISGSHTLCPGDTNTLAITNGCSYCTYNWNTGATTSFINVTTPGNYSAYSIDQCGQNWSGYFNVANGTLPTANAGADVTIVAGDTATLTGNGGISCAWSPGTFLDDSTNCSTTANPPATTNYTLTVTGSNGCRANDVMTVNITTCSDSIDPLTQSFGYFGGMDSIIVVPNSNNCAWTATTSDAWIHLVNPTGTGTGVLYYTVDSCSNSNNQTGTITVGTETYTVNQSCLSTGLAGMATDRNLFLFPNPAEESVVVTITGFDGNCRVILYDAFGRVVFEKQINADQKMLRVEIPLSNYAGGMYWITVSDDNGHLTQKFTRQ